MTVLSASASLAGRHVLVPRGGDVGDRLVTLLRQAGATAEIAPLIDFAPPADPAPLADALMRLASGHYDWLAITSATTVTVLADARATIPDSTRVAAVGDATAAALAYAGYRVDFVPASDYSAAGMLAGLPGGGHSVLLPQSAIATPGLAEGLSARGFAVDAVEAYSTIPVDPPPAVAASVATGRFDAVLLTSGSVAREVARRFSPIPTGVAIACLGEPTAKAARAAGLTVAVVAAHASAADLVDAVAQHIGPAPRATRET